MSFQGKHNIYKCPDGHLTVTIDRDDGVTPYLTSCTHSGCQELARSHIYNPMCQVFEPTHEWYKPTLEEATHLELNEATLEHIRRGGLILREMEKKEN